MQRFDRWYQTQITVKRSSNVIFFLVTAENIKQKTQMIHIDNDKKNHIIGFSHQLAYSLQRPKNLGPAMKWVSQMQFPISAINLIIQNVRFQVALEWIHKWNHE